MFFFEMILCLMGLDSSPPIGSCCFWWPIFEVYWVAQFVVFAKIWLIDSPLFQIPACTHMMGRPSLASARELGTHYMILCYLWEVSCNHLLLPVDLCIYTNSTFQSTLPLQTNQLSLVQCVYTIEQLAEIVVELLHKININAKILEFNLPHRIATKRQFSRSFTNE